MIFNEIVLYVEILAMTIKIYIKNKDNHNIYSMYNFLSNPTYFKLLYIRERIFYLCTFIFYLLIVVAKTSLMSMI